MAGNRPGSRLYSLSQQLTALPPRVLLILPVYAACLYATSLIERRIGATNPHGDESLEHVPLRLPDTLTNYESRDLANFLSRIGSTSRWWYMCYLILELPSLLMWTVLVIMPISAITGPLVAAEQRLIAPLVVLRNDASALREEEEVDKHPDGTSHTPSSTNPFPATLLNLVPFLILFCEVVENLILIIAVSGFDAPLAGWPRDRVIFSIASHAAPPSTRIKWTVTRLSFTLILVTLLAGWARVYITRLKIGEPVLGEGPTFPPLRPGSEKLPRGLTPASMVSAKTWKPADQRVNNKKKKRR
ncbi:hypothetical protein SpCBS45565_g07924 [Spizellomyces sp. 'palustris']|nr:hypothetical protein SpCBS45565_g07924 [Spizellomyces sp. 'palustris']